MADLHNLNLTPPATGAQANANAAATAPATTAARTPATRSATARAAPPAAPNPAAPTATPPGEDTGPAPNAQATGATATEEAPSPDALEAAHYRARAEALERIVAALPQSGDPAVLGAFSASPTKDARRVVLPPAIPGFKSNALDNGEFNLFAALLPAPRRAFLPLCPPWHLCRPCYTQENCPYYLWPALPAAVPPTCAVLLAYVPH